MHGSWRIFIFHPEHQQALALTSLVSTDARFQCRTFTQPDSALDYLETAIQDIALIHEWCGKANPEASFLASIPERQVHIPIITLCDEDRREEASNNGSQIRLLPWPCTAKEVITALEELLDTPSSDICAPIGVPDSSYCEGNWSSTHHHSAPKRTADLNTFTQPMKSKDQTFACYWLHQSTSPISAENIHHQIQKVGGQVIELVMDDSLMFLAASTPRRVDLRQLICSLTVETEAYLFCHPAQTIGEQELREFIHFARTQPEHGERTVAIAR